MGTGGEGGSGPATTTSGPGGGGGGVGGAECEIPPDCPVPGDFCLDRYLEIDPAHGHPLCPRTHDIDLHPAERFVVDRQKFERRVQEKAARIANGAAEG